MKRACPEFFWKPEKESALRPHTAAGAAYISGKVITARPLLSGAILSFNIVLCSEPGVYSCHITSTPIV
jgi:hypothetical protein